MADLAVPIVEPKEALDFFRGKGLAYGFAWQDVWQEEHARAFTVAKAMCPDLLGDIRAAVDRAIAEGETLDQFRTQLKPILEARGWWGKQQMVDPLTGETKLVQLGSPRRLKTIFDTNMRTAYAAGRWARIERNAAAFPFLRYVTAGDARVRPQHREWNGTILPVTDPWWDTHYPPCGWNCRCQAQPLNQRTMDRRGLAVTEKPKTFMKRTYVNPRTGEVTKVENGIDPGFSYNVGKAYMQRLSPAPPLGAAARGGLEKLEQSDIEALKLYSGYGGAMMNRRLRGLSEPDEDESEEELQAAITGIDRAFARGVGLEGSTTLWRGVAWDHAAEIRQGRWKVGDTYVDPGYIITSRNGSQAREKFASIEGAVMIRIFARGAGLPALDITEISRYGDEAEVMIARGTGFRVRRVDLEAGVLDLEWPIDGPSE